MDRAKLFETGAEQEARMKKYRTRLAQLSDQSSKLSKTDHRSLLAHEKIDFSFKETEIALEMAKILIQMNQFQKAGEMLSIMMEGVARLKASNDMVITKIQEEQDEQNRSK